MRSLTLHTPMLGLALLAMLLMALAPSACRLLGSAGTQPLSAGWEALCSSAGRTWGKTAAASRWQTPAAPAGALADGDCAYCPLLASLPWLLAWLCALFPRLPACRLTPMAVFRPRPLCNGRGLGGQGPPILL
jgi:hypothetical protein